jgi:exopolyphosphatase/guanosine-5'-triphosphate,3'-diphosphate pyrophosphatase
MDEQNYPLRVMQGYAIPTRDAILFCEKVRKTKKLSLLPGIDDVARARREVLPYGALVLERLLKLLAPSEVIFSVYGIREGLVFSLLPESERRKDPLLCFCEDYAKLRSRSYEHALELCAWTDALFDHPDLIETPEEKRLRHAACLMSDIGWRAHPDYRGEKSLNVIAQSGLVGTDHAGRMFIALAVYFRHVGTSENSADDLSERLKTAISKRALKRARIVGAAIRAAHMLSIGMPNVIDETPLSYEDETLVLTLPKSYANLDGERLRRRFEALAALVGHQSLIRVAR